MVEDTNKFNQGSGSEQRERPETDELLQTGSLAKLANLLGSERTLIDHMLRRTHALVKTAFEWKKGQNLTGLRLGKQWESYPGGPKKNDHIRYYYLVEEEGGQQLIFEIFKLYLVPSPYTSGVFEPDHLCVVEYVVGAENPLEFDRDTVVGATIFARHGSSDLVNENFKEAIRLEALAVASYKENYPIFDERSGEHRISGAAAAFGWSIPSSSIHRDLHTGVYGDSIPTDESSFNRLFYRRNYGAVDDPLDSAQRRLDLLAKAKLIGVSEPPEYQITSFLKS